MSHTTIWIDQKHAFIFEFSADKVQEKNMSNSGNTDDEHLKKFFHEVAGHLGSPNQLLIVGPGTAKEEFKNHLEDHHHTLLAKAVVGTETMKDHPKKAEILDVSKKFFDHHFRWNND